MEMCIFIIDNQKIQLKKDLAYFCTVNYIHNEINGIVNWVKRYTVYL